MQMFSFKFLPPTLIFSPLFIRTMTFSEFKSRAAEQFSGNYVTKTFFFKIMFEFMQDAVDMADQS